MILAVRLNTIPENFFQRLLSFQNAICSERKGCGLVQCELGIWERVFAQRLFWYHIAFGVSYIKGVYPLTLLVDPIDC
jgi:hypothetical protein